MTDLISKKKFPFQKIVFIITGLAAFIWFLIRVIPKPSRATYPCQRAAFPMATAFIIWLTGYLASITLVKQAKVLVKNGRVLAGATLLVSGLALFAFNGLIIDKSTAAGSIAITSGERFEPTDNSNEPVGVARGIFPGRVVWAFDTAATSWNGETTTTECDGVTSATSCWKTTNAWWSNFNMDVVKEMLENSLQTLTGASDTVTVWDSLFTYYNRTHNRGVVGYQPGEKIAIKVNLNTVGAHEDESNACYVSPQLVYLMLEQLVENAGVAEGDITFYDISRPMPATIFDFCKAKYPNVNFIDNQGGNGRKMFQVDTTVPVAWSEDLNLEIGGGNPTYLPNCVTEATYLINMTNLKGHDLTGVTVCAKNHFGTFCTLEGGSAPQKAGVHPYIAVHDFGNPGGTGKWDFYGRDMETYTPMVDVMGHPHLGEKTVLYLVDAFYTVRRQNFDVTIEDKWQMEPFNGDWPSSLLLSLDGVAIESVGLDFLRSEPTQFNVTGNVDNYLHEAAEAAAPSSGTFYDPDGDNIALSSLGVHEHWNNEIDKQYSRNLGTGEGIELVMAEKQVINDINMLANHTIQFSIIGNPVSNKLMVELSNHTGRITCQVIDLGGKTVRSKDFRIHGQNEKVQLDVSDLEQGIYILNVISEKGYRKAEKFIKD
jgi:uncharacterized protein (DUF362 family)